RQVFGCEKRWLLYRIQRPYDADGCHTWIGRCCPEEFNGPVAYVHSCQHRYFERIRIGKEDAYRVRTRGFQTEDAEADHRVTEREVRLHLGVVQEHIGE